MEKRVSPAFSGRFGKYCPTQERHRSIPAGAQTPECHKPAQGTRQGMEYSASMRKPQRQVEIVLNHGTMLQVLCFARGRTDLGRRKVLDEGLCSKNRLEPGTQSQAELQIFAAHPKIIPVQACLLKGATGHQQRDPLCPYQFLSAP